MHDLAVDGGCLSYHKVLTDSPNRSTFAISGRPMTRRHFNDQRFQVGICNWHLLRCTGRKTRGVE